jgi:hypothetical protein
MGKKSDEQGIIEEFSFLDKALVGVYEKGDLGDGEKADSQWQHDMQQRDVETECQVDILEEEIHVFEITKEQDIHNESEDQDGTFRNESFLLGIQVYHQTSDGVVKQNRTENERQVVNFPPAVKKQRGKEQPGIRGNRQSDSIQQKEHHQRNRKEKENKYI